jgi:transposase
MPFTVPLRDDYDADGLRTLAKLSRDPCQIRRLLALAAVYDGMSRAEAAMIGGMDRQTLRDWAHRFNEGGPEGLTNRPGAGRPRQLSDDQMCELAEIVETGPDPAVDGVVRWRRIDLKRVIEARFGVVYSERAITSSSPSRKPSCQSDCETGHMPVNNCCRWYDFRRKALNCRIPVRGRDDNAVARDQRRVGPDSHWYEA